MPAHLLVPAGEDPGRALHRDLAETNAFGILSNAGDDIGRLLVEEQDEYLRMLLVRQTLVATGFTLTIVTVWGFLENLDLVAHVDAFYVAILWFVGLGVGSCFNWLTLKRDGE